MDDVNVRPGLIAVAMNAVAVLVAFVPDLTNSQWGIRLLLLRIISVAPGQPLEWQLGGRRIEDSDRNDR